MKYSDTLARSLMGRYPNPDSYPYRSWCYSQGFLLWGFARLYEKTGDPDLRDYVLKYCDGHVSPSGGIQGFSGESLDDMMAASLLVWAFGQTGEERYRTACRQVRRAFDDYPRNPDGGFWHGRSLNGEMWVDGLFMGLMFLVRYGAEIDPGDRDFCFGEAIRQLNTVFSCCEKDNSGLLYHAYSACQETPWAHPVTGKSSEVWSEGLGWYAMILCDVLGILPADFIGRDSLLRQLLKLLSALEQVQDSACGLWYQVVDKIHDCGNWHDTSGSAMFLYTYKKAQLLGLTEPGQYETVMEKGFRGIKTKYLLDAEGNVNILDACDGLCVQQDYAHYIHYPKTINAKEAVAAVLWAAAAMEYEAI